MQALQKTLQLVATQLRGLQTTAKLLIASLMIILVMALAFVALYSGRPRMVPLSLTPEGRTAALTYLQSANLPHDDLGGKVYVPVEQQYVILGQLTQQGLVNPNQIDFATMIEDENPFRSREDNRRHWLVAKMNVLAQTISKWNGISSATVVIDEPVGHAGLGRAAVGPTASVNVVTSDAELGQSQVDAIARFVAKSHPGLKIQNVAVVDATTGRSHQPRSDDDLSGDKYLELKQKTEKLVHAKLLALLDYIPGVRVAVNATVDSRRVEQRSETYQDPKVGPREEMSETRQSTQVTRGGEPGVLPNTGAAIAGSSSGQGSQQSEERTAAKLSSMFPVEVAHVFDPKGNPIQINATIALPRSYFVRLHRQEQGDENAQPDAAALQQLEQRETDRIKAQIEPLIRTAATDGVTPGEVMVSMYQDFAAEANPPAGAAPPGASGGWADSIGVNDGLVKYVGLGTLALVSLAMMFLMVRKANVSEELPTAQELVGVPPALDAEESDLVGEADESTPALEGVELDDAGLRRQQMLTQINEMVISEPDEAANLVRKWLRTMT